MLSALVCPYDGWATVLAQEGTHGAAPDPEAWVLGRFRLEAVVEQAGRITIYDGRGDRDEPVRLTLIALAGDDDGARRWSIDRTLEVLAGLEHPGVDRVIASGMAADGLLAVVTGPLQGETLAELLARGPLDSERVVEIGLTLSGALEAAHRQDVFHRALTTREVRIGSQGRALISGLGIADIARRPRSWLESAVEGAAGGEPRHEDVHALGAILFEALTGERPSEDTARVIAALTDMRVEHPLREFVGRCLATEAWNRYDSAKQAHEALAAARVTMDMAGPQGEGRLAGLVWGEPEPLRPAAEGDPEPAVIFTEVGEELEALPPIAQPLLRHDDALRDRAWWPVALVVLALGVGAATALWIASHRPPEPAPDEITTVPIERLSAALEGAAAQAERARVAQARAEAAAELEAKAARLAVAEERRVAAVVTDWIQLASAFLEASWAAAMTARRPPVEEGEETMSSRSREAARETIAQGGAVVPAPPPHVYAPEPGDELDKEDLDEEDPVEMRRALLATVPAGASVAVEGRVIGVTPMTVSWPMGHGTEAAITLDGYLPTSVTLGERQHAKMLTLELVSLPTGERVTGP